jgi:UDP-N-acetylglucosamine transferase subunit ALG13
MKTTPATTSVTDNRQEPRRPLGPIASHRSPGPVLLVCSSGGHLTQLLALRPWWGSRERAWVTSDSAHSRSALHGETTTWGHFPTTRNIPNLIRNFALAGRLLAPRAGRPSVIISTGAGLALPFFVVGRFLRIPTVYIEVFGRVDSRTMTGRLCRPFSRLFLVQWEEQRMLYPGAIVAGELLGVAGLPGKPVAPGRPGEPELLGLPRLFVTIGTDHHPFTRVVSWVERWLGDGGGQRVDAVIQHGATVVTPGPGKVKQLDYTDLLAALRGASIVITHAGATAMEARSAGHVPIIVPRRPELGEHVDGHQLRFGRWLEAKGFAVICDTEDELRAALDRAVAASAPQDAGHNGAPVAGNGRPSVADGMALWSDDGPAPGVRRVGELVDALLGASAVRPGSRPAARSAVGPDAGADDAPAEPGRWPGVTVVVPTLGQRPELLDLALRRIRDQDYPGPVNCLVVLDRPSGSTAADDGADPAQETRLADARDATRAIAAAAAAHLIENGRTPGLAGSRNTGILAARDELVAFCDDDDAWLPGKLRAQVAALAAEPEAILACCGIEISYGQAVTQRVHPRRTVTYRELLRSRLAALHPSTFVIRRSALLNEIGLVSEEIPGSQAEDYELLLRAARRGPVLNVPVPGVLVSWQGHRTAMHASWPMIAVALPWLLDHYPDFRTVPPGYARLAGRIAFAAAACGDRTAAWRWAWRSVRASPREPRPYLAIAVMAGLIRPDALVRALHKRGRGI